MAPIGGFNKDYFTLKITKDMAYDPPSNQIEVSRPLNTWWLVNPQRGSTIVFSVVINTSATLVAGTIGRVFLERGTSTDGGVTVTPATNPLNVQRVGLNSGLLNPGGPSTQTLSGIIPTGQYARLRSDNELGTPTYSNPSTGAANSAYGWESYNG